VAPLIVFISKMHSALSLLVEGTYKWERKPTSPFALLVYALYDDTFFWLKR